MAVGAVMLSIGLIPGITRAAVDVQQDTAAEARVTARVEALLSRMTLEEKIGQMTQLNNTTINKTGEQRNLELDEAKARDYILTHHVGSFLNGEGEPAEDWRAFITAIQRIAVEESRLGIPILYGIDHMHGASYLKGATVFPHAINAGATFNPENARLMGRVTAVESAPLGHRWNFAPVLDLARDPRWPRHYETFGESPYLAAAMGAAYTQGLQDTTGLSGHYVAGTAKHFLGYSDPRSGWDRTPVDISDQTLVEFHLPAFKAAIDAGVKTLMVNSGEINGVPVHGSAPILTTLLRDELGFEGVVVTDWDDIGKMYEYHHTAETYKEAVYQAVAAGIDMSMTPLHLQFNEALLELVKEGRITESRIDDSLRRILRLKVDLGLFEHPYPADAGAVAIATPEHRQAALEAAGSSLVLLKNEGVLPLSDTRQKVLLVGPSVASKRNLSGGWTIAWQGGEEERFPAWVKTVEQAMRQEFSKIRFLTVPDWRDGAAVRKAASEADLVIAVIGEEPYTEFVGNLTDMALPQDQVALIGAASSAKAPVVGVYVGGRPRLVGQVIDGLDAFLWAGLPGFMGADAIADVLSGKVNPSGRLPFSYPRYPAHFVPHNHKPSDIYFFNPAEANDIQQGGGLTVWQFPFGAGLSYTSFAYSGLTVDSLSGEAASARFRAQVTVTNTGDISGTETVLWYLQDVKGSVTRPVRELKKIDRVHLAAGESKTLTFDIQALEHLAYPVPGNRLRLEPGTFRVKVGGLETDFSFSASTPVLSEISTEK